MKTGIELIAEERKRQVEKEGWSAEHDVLHINNELAAAAACYALSACGHGLVTAFWPPDWSLNDFKPKGQLSDLVRAGALIAAEIDRIKRNRTS